MSKKGKQGFASMDPDYQREVARKGGKASQRSGKGHRFTSETGAEAGKKGGAVMAERPDYMSKIGKKGGIARGRQRTKEKNARNA